MKISGFTIARGAVQFGYQLEESIRSLLPVVDEFIVGVGDMDDGTLELVEGIGDPKIKIFHSVWDMTQREGGKVLATETNKVLDRCTGDWAVYLQADEVLHEDDLPKLRAAIDANANNDIEALYFDYLHFYGSFWTVQDDYRKWYKTAPRAFKLGMEIRSFGDDWGFHRWVNGVERRCKKVDCGVRVFHYGWSRPPEVMVQKQRNFDSLYHDEAWVAAKYAQEDLKVRQFYRDCGNLKYFQGTHPTTMLGRVAAQDWAFEHGIERQLPDWLRHLQQRFVYPIWEPVRRRLSKDA